MRHLANAQYWDRPAGGNTGRLFLAFGGPVCADRISICPLDRVLTYKNLIYLLNLQFSLYYATSYLSGTHCYSGGLSQRQAKLSLSCPGLPLDGFNSQVTEIVYCSSLFSFSTMIFDRLDLKIC